MSPSVTRYYDQLLSCTIFEKTNDPILTDEQTDESDFIGRCPTNVERTITVLTVTTSEYNHSTI